MKVNTAFEMIPRDKTELGDILQIAGSWCLRVNVNRILYLNGRSAGNTEPVDDKPCLRLKGFKELGIDFADISDATTDDHQTKNPLVHVANGFAFYAKIGSDHVLYDFDGKQIDSQPCIRTGPWIAIARNPVNNVEVRLF